MNAEAARLLKHGDVAEFNKKFGNVTVDLAGADLRGADLGGARLVDAILDGADLRGAKLGRTDLRRASIKNVQLGGAVFLRANLAKARIGPIAGDEVTLHQCHFANAEIAGAAGRLWKLTVCNFRDARLAAVQLSDCELDEVSFAGAAIDRVSIAGKQSKQIDFTRASGTELHWSLLTTDGFDLTEAKLERVAFGQQLMRGVILDGAQLGRVEGAKTMWMQSRVAGARVERFSFIDSAINETIFRSSTLGAVELTGSELLKVVIENCSLARLDVERARLLHFRATNTRAQLGASGSLLLGGLVMIDSTPALAAIHRGATRGPSATIVIDGAKV